MRKMLVAGNWKMHGTRASVASLVEALGRGGADAGEVEVAVFPPYVFLVEVAQALRNSGIRLGAQDVCDRDDGAFTGEVSGHMLADCGCRYVIIGHSERRHIFGESDALTASKYAAALRAALCPILCVGETLTEREAGQTEAVLARQIDAVVAEVGASSLARSVVAYEPVWAIGTGKTATADQAQSAHAFIRRRLERHAGEARDGLRILYGGSVKPDNASDLFAMPDVDGGLIGGASLEADAFLAICRAAR
jgi:triosephosphate isomerase (TIM)